MGTDVYDVHKHHSPLRLGCSIDNRYKGWTAGISWLLCPYRFLVFYHLLKLMIVCRHVKKYILFYCMRAWKRNKWNTWWEYQTLQCESLRAELKVKCNLCREDRVIGAINPKYPTAIDESSNCYRWRIWLSWFCAFFQIYVCLLSNVHMLAHYCPIKKGNLIFEIVEL